MRRLIFALPFLSMILACSRNVAPEFSAVQYVDPQIGSVHGPWFHNEQPAKYPLGYINCLHQ